MRLQNLMEQKFYKIRLKNGRVIGPIDLERVKLFILKDQVTGLENARLYPTGDWKDINTFPELAELFMLKLEGKLVADTLSAPKNEPADQSSGNTAALGLEPGAGSISLAKSGITIQEVPPVPAGQTRATNTPALQTTPSLNNSLIPGVEEEIASPTAPTKTIQEGEPTMMMTADDERTVMVTNEEPPKNSGLELEPHGTEIKIDPSISQEKTAMLEYQRPEIIQLTGGKPLPSFTPTEPVVDKKSAQKKKIFTAVVAAALLVVVLVGTDDKTPKTVATPLVIQLPNAQQNPDPGKSEKLFAAGLKPYVEDTVEGYKKAAKLFLEAASWDPNNVRALCLLASSYMNLIDVVNRDEMYFNVITNIIEMERAKGLDLAETVIADVELYHILNNPDAAITRIIEFSKTHQWGVEMLYYLGMSFYIKGKFPEALQQLNKIDPKDYYSAKISILYGMIFEKSNQPEAAIKAFEDAVKRSPRHIKARARLAELYFGKDNMPEASKNAELVIANDFNASKQELARSYYVRGRIQQAGNRDIEALKDIETALKITPDDPDITLEYFTLKAKLGAKVADASGKAKMFYYLAEGEKALKNNDLDSAMTHFLSARDAAYDDASPLIKLAEVFKRKGDLQSAKVNLGKAVALEKKRTELYPKYIQTLIDAFEFEEASAMLARYKDLNPPVATVDRLQGDYYFKQEELQKSLAYYKRALSTTNADPNIYISYSNLMFRAGNFRDAAFYYGLAQRFDPYNIDATVGKGKALSELEGLEAAIEYMQNALEQSPYKAALLNGIAEIYQRKGDNTSALRFADNALMTDPQFAKAHKVKGDALASQEKLKEALDEYLTYTNLVPLDPSGHIERYKIFLKKLDLKAAKEAIQKVIDNYPKYPGAFYMLGDLFREGQNYKSALEAAEQEIKNNPGYIQAYVLAGTAQNLMAASDHERARQEAGYTAAIATLNKALKMNPTYVPALIQAGFANHKLKTYAAAQTMLERALQVDPGNPQVHKRLGSLYHDIGNLDKAKHHFRAYLDLYPDAPDRKDMETYLSGS